MSRSAKKCGQVLEVVGLSMQRPDFQLSALSRECSSTVYGMAIHAVVDWHGRHVVADVSSSMQMYFQTLPMQKIHRCRCRHVVWHGHGRPPQNYMPRLHGLASPTYQGMRCPLRVMWCGNMPPLAIRARMSVALGMV